MMLQWQQSGLESILKHHHTPHSNIHLKHKYYQSQYALELYLSNLDILCTNFLCRNQLSCRVELNHDEGYSLSWLSVMGQGECCCITQDGQNAPTPCCFYPVKEKIEHCKRALELIEKTGISQTMAATNLGLDNSMLSKWIWNLPIFKLQVLEATREGWSIGINTWRTSCRGQRIQGEWFLCFEEYAYIPSNTTVSTWI